MQPEQSTQIRAIQSSTFQLFLKSIGTMVRHIIRALWIRFRQLMLVCFACAGMIAVYFGPDFLNNLLNFKLGESHLWPGLMVLMLLIAIPYLCINGSNRSKRNFHLTADLYSALLIAFLLASDPPSFVLLSALQIIFWYTIGYEIMTETRYLWARRHPQISSALEGQ